MPWKRGQRLHLVTPEEACAEAAEVYADIQDVLNVPFVDKLHQAYGVFPKFLQAHWEQFRKIAETEQFFACAERLGADAYTRVHSYLMVPDIRSELAAAKVSEAAQREVRNSVDLFHSTSTYWLLIAAWQMRAFDGPVGREVDTQLTEPADDGHLPIIVKDEAMGPSTKKILDEIRKGSEAPSLDTFYVAMARWPDLLEGFWRRMRVEMASPLYENSKQSVFEYAGQLCNELPGPFELTTVQLLDVMEEKDIGSIVRITEAFEKSLSALVLHVAWTQIGLEGGNLRRRPKDAVAEKPIAPSAA